MLFWNWLRYSYTKMLVCFSNLCIILKVTITVSFLQIETGTLDKNFKFMLALRG